MDWDIYLRSLLAFGVVVVLIGAAAWLGRRFGAGGIMMARGRRQRRLSVLEVLPLDNRRRLVLVRRDAVEHLLLIGGASDIIVEKGGSASYAAIAAGLEEKDADR
jgi:flagellar protein FliO/FliZ